MPSIKQIIAEIQLAATLGPNQKSFVVQAIRDAEQRLTLKLIGTKVRKISNAKGLVTLEAWETGRGKELHYTDLTAWIAKHRLCEFSVRMMIEEFRAEMQAKGKQYADFSRAFNVYLTKGYLSKKMSDCTIERSPYRQQTVIDKRGVNL